MAAVAQSGAREALAYPTTPLRRGPSQDKDNGSSSPSSARSPRCEAFVMTGDKILSLDHHVSPSYAKVARDQLPPRTLVQDSPKRPPLSDFPSQQRRSGRSRLPISLSQPEHVTRRQISCPESSMPSSAGPSTSSQTENAPPPSDDVIDPDTPTVSTGSATPSSGALPSPPDDPHGDIIRHPAPSSGMESSMHSSYYKSAFSNPQLTTNKRTGSSDTFVISTSDSPTKHSSVTVNATSTSICAHGGAASVSAANSPSLRRVLGTRNQHEVSLDGFGSFRSSATDCQADSPSSREEREAARLASRLFRLEGFARADVTARLNDNSEFSSLVATKYLELFTFSGLRIDAAVRDFLDRVELRGETSQRERLLRFFSARYHEANPSLFSSVDEVHTLTCALLLLNSDLHGPNSGRKMALRDFVNNIGHTGVQIKRDLLKTLYTSIKENAIAHNSNEPESSPVKTTKRPFVSRQMLLEVDPESQVEYKSGWILKKSVYDSDGAKTPFGRRGWRMWFARLRGLVLYLERDEGEKKRSRYETFNNAVLLHHSFAEPAADYKKKQHIVRLRTANLGEILFQTSSASEVSDWVSQINFVCAAFSSRSLPPPAGSQPAFVRARLPKMPSQAPLSEQLKAHESASSEMRRQLAVVQESAPPLKARGRLVEEFFFRERYLTQEIARYDEYCVLLQRRLGGGGTAASDSTSGVHSKSDIVDELDKMSYREALHQ